jgi:SAM-dependent methyltransferase
MLDNNRSRWDEKYQSGVTPWDTGVTPPEVCTFWESGKLSTQGTAVDLGCGPATNVIYLASLGLNVVGCEISGVGLSTAAGRVARQPLSLRERILLVQCDVSQQPFDLMAADYVLDIGCLHGLPFHQRLLYAQQVAALLAPGGYYHLFAFDNVGVNDDDLTKPPRGMAENEVEQLFQLLRLREVIIARPDRQPCRWYLLQKP